MPDLSAVNPTWLDLPIGRLRCRVAGEGPPLLFVHGLLVDSRLWERVAQPLSESHQVILPDLPLGSHTEPVADRRRMHPEGVAQTLVDLLDALGLERATVIGNDTGGALTQIAVASAPERFERLVLTSCDAFEHFPPPLILPFRWIAGSDAILRMTSWLLSSPRFQLWALPLGWVAKHPLDPELTASLAEPALTQRAIRDDVAAFLKKMEPTPTLDAAKKLASYPGPALIAWSSEDRIFPKSDAHKLAELLPKAQLTWIDDAYAFASLDQPEVLANRIAHFLAETDPGA